MFQGNAREVSARAAKVSNFGFPTAVIRPKLYGLAKV